MTQKPGFLERVARFFFGSIIERAVNAAVSVRVDDSPGWDSLSGGGPADSPWSEKYEDLTDTLQAWKKNFLVRRIVNLTHSYVVGDGITATSKIPDVDKFIKAFWTHPKNHMASRLIPICDELTRAGEVFPILFTNRVDGMSYVRFVPASLIRNVETDPEDYETELRYEQITAHEPKFWYGVGHKYAFKRARGGPGGTLKPLMLHFAVNRPIGATRGESDLTPILPWAKRYAEWLKDRIRFNRRRTRQGVFEVELSDDSQVEAKRKQLQTSNPLDHGVYVHGKGETITMHSLAIGASSVKDDGKAIRLAVATGANVGLHYLGEGETINYATAKEMGEPTARFYTNRQNDLRRFLVELITAAYHRYCVVTNTPLPSGGAGGGQEWDLQLSTAVTEVARADNAGLATAAREIVQALAQMKEQGWIDDPTAIRLAFKFAGEIIGEEQIKRILATTPPSPEEGSGEGREGE